MDKRTLFLRKLDYHWSILVTDEMQRARKERIRDWPELRPFLIDKWWLFYFVFWRFWQNSLLARWIHKHG